MPEFLETKDAFCKALADAGGALVVIDFYADWCGPCRMISPKFAAMESEFPGVKFYKVNVDENTDTSEECKISAMPTFQFFKNGKKVDELVGASEEKLRNMIKKNQ